jgi:hypothetical protein
MPWYAWIGLVIVAFNLGIVVFVWLARTKHDSWAPRG